MQAFMNELEEKKKKIEEIIRNYAPQMKAKQSSIAEAMNYSYLAWGKRIRPILVLEAYRLFGGEKEELAAPFVAAIEMIHAYSLIHDDLPAMDDDDFRRGRPTNHMIYGEAMAILAGDALLNYAYETGLKAFQVAETMEEYKQVVRALEILSSNAGMFGMVTGQVMDMNMGGEEKTIDFLAKMYELKTGALLRASFMIGAALAGGSEEEILLMKGIGEDIGLAFQLRDDVLDIEGDSHITGKATDRDMKNQKLTYFKMLGAEQTEMKIAELSGRAKESLRELQKKKEEYDGFVIRLIEYLESRDR